jgi:hypothetical protein
MTQQELRRKARTENADVLASILGLDATTLRRWIAGGVNADVEARMQDYALTVFAPSERPGTHLSS